MPGKADIRRLTGNVALDVVKCTDTVESLTCDLGFIRGPDIVEVAPAMMAWTAPSAGASLGDMKAYQ